MPAGLEHYDGVPYADMVFAEVDWSEIGDHDPARRAERRGTTEANVHTEWATEACQDRHRWVRSAESRSGRTVKVTGWSASAGFLITVVLAPKDQPPPTAVVGRDRMEGEDSRAEEVRGGMTAMNESIRDMLAREAEEAEAAADAREDAGSAETGGQRARTQAGEASQVYSLRIPVDRLEQLRRLAEERGVRPTVLLRQFVLDRLDRESAPVTIATLPERDPNELRLGPPRGAPPVDVVPLQQKRA